MTNKHDNSHSRLKFSAVVKAFLIFPVLIATGCVIFFTGMHFLTREPRTAYDYLEDIKMGGRAKRWQSAFRLSKILADSQLIPVDQKFFSQLTSAFEHAKHDEGQVRQYLALAMGRTRRKEFLMPLLKGLKEDKESREENLPAIIYALGMLKQKESAPMLYAYTKHANARIRSLAVVALGNIGDVGAKVFLKDALVDSEVNVQWGAAISLARMGDSSGKDILLQLIDRQYFSMFPEVDLNEQDLLMQAALNALELL